MQAYSAPVNMSLSNVLCKTKNFQKWNQKCLVCVILGFKFKTILLYLKSANSNLSERFFWPIQWILAECYNNFFSWRFQIKVNDFFNFFSTINFPYQYLPEAKAYLEPSRTFCNGAFSRNIFFFAKFTRKHLYWSLILSYRSLSCSLTEGKNSNTGFIWWILRVT